MYWSRVRSKVGGQALFDAISWVAAVFLAGLLRYEFDVGRLDVLPFFVLGASIAVVSFTVGKLLSLYGARHSVGTSSELYSLTLVTFIAAAPFAFFTFLYGVSWAIPRSAVLIAAPIFLVLSGSVRALRRSRANKKVAPHRRKPVLIYGAGSMADKLIPQLLEDPQSLFLPVGLIDDDPRRSNRWIAGVKMMGSFSHFTEIVARTKASGVVVAIPRASPELLRKVRDASDPLGVKVFILPNFSEILSSSVDRVALRDLGIEDLVGRRSITVQSPKIDSLLRDKRVLITGAGGSIGQELCKQVANYAPKELVFLDRDETALQQAQLRVESTGLLDSPNLVLADIRDSATLAAVFSHHLPEVVFHAAALKHLPLLEKFPDEAWKTNVMGTLNVLNASLKVDVTTFVNVSTDKAADPSSVLGHSKLLSEELTAWASGETAGNYLSVRFGNVLGSRGSLVPTLAYLLENDLPITITDPDATRYFMTIPEACELVLQAGTEVSPASVFILDMGEPVKILDIAKRMIDLTSTKTDITFTGLRPGEKLHETLQAPNQELRSSTHPLVWATTSKVTEPTLLPKIEKTWVTRVR